LDVPIRPIFCVKLLQHYFFEARLQLSLFYFLPDWLNSDNLPPCKQKFQPIYLPIGHPRRTLAFNPPDTTAYPSFVLRPCVVIEVSTCPSFLASSLVGLWNLQVHPILARMKGTRHDLSHQRSRVEAHPSQVVLQRVKSASVTVDGKLIASIGKGILAFAAISKDDTLNDSVKSASRLLKMKLWEDENGGKVGSRPCAFHCCWSI
jgi:hypothetical protein